MLPRHLCLVLLIGLPLVASCAPDATADDTYFDVAQLPSGATMPNAAIDAAGAVHAVYVSRNDLHYVSSSDGGRTFTRPVRINSRPGFAASGLFRGPEIAVGAGGALHVTWYNRAWQQDMPLTDYGVMYSRLHPGGAVAVERNMTGGAADGYSVSASGQRVDLLWHTDDRLSIASSLDGGANFSTRAVSGALPCECCDTALHLDANGRDQFLYRDRRQNRRDMYFVVMEPGATTGQRSRVDRDSWVIEACPVSGSDLAVGEGGRFATWENQGRVFAASLSADEGAAADPVDLGKGKFPVLATSGDLVLVAFKASSRLNWIVLDASSMARRASGSIAAPGSDRPAVLAKDRGRFLLFP
jgi:hypothetical protein